MRKELYLGLAVLFLTFCISFSTTFAEPLVQVVKTGTDSKFPTFTPEELEEHRRKYLLQNQKVQALKSSFETINELGIFKTGNVIQVEEKGLLTAMYMTMELESIARSINVVTGVFKELPPHTLGKTVKPDPYLRWEIVPIPLGTSYTLSWFNYLQQYNPTTLIITAPHAVGKDYQELKMIAQQENILIIMVTTPLFTEEDVKEGSKTRQSVDALINFKAYKQKLYVGVTKTEGDETARFTLPIPTILPDAPNPH